VRDWKARSDFSLDFFQVAAFKAVESKGFSTNEDACKAFLESGAEIVVICSTDDKYPEFVPEFTKLVKDAKPTAKVVVAGYPADHIDNFKAAGVDEFIHVKANAYEINYNLQKQIGIRK
jgi:methylmalonyl-CoA mutase